MNTREIAEKIYEALLNSTQEISDSETIYNTLDKHLAAESEAMSIVRRLIAWHSDDCNSSVSWEAAHDTYTHLIKDARALVEREKGK